MTLLWALLLIGLLVIVHELGHFFAARLFDIKVLRLSFGFGRRLASLRGRETEYVWSLVPIGGYVKMLGEDPDDVVDPVDRGRAFHDKPRWQQLLVVFAGPLANLLLPGIIYFHYYLSHDTTLSPTVGSVFEGQPAADVLRPGDRVLAVDDESIHTWDDLNRAVVAAPGRDLHLTIERPGEDRPFVKVVTPRAHVRRDLLGARETVGLLGISPRFRLAQIGVQTGAATPSPAERAGLRSFDVITSVQGRPVGSWHDLEVVLGRSRGEAVVLSYLRPTGTSQGFAAVERLEPGTAQLFPDRVVQGGKARYETGIRSGELFVHDVDPGSPAAAAGIARGDELVSLDGQPILHFELLAQTFEEQPDRRYRIGYRNQRGEVKEASILLQPRTSRDEYQTESTLYVFGAEPARATRPVAWVPIEGRFSWAARRAAAMLSSVTTTTVRIVGLMLAGRVPATAIGGPIMIYHLAGVAAAHGVEQFLAITALLSLNLGLLNLLPIPVLDGGTIVFMSVEALRGRPVGRRTRERASVLGLALLAALTLLAARNDIVRYWFS